MFGRTFTLVLIAFATADAGPISPRVIGGRDADTIYPYQASLRVSGSHKCGGSLISREWILTAAHCLVKHSGFTVVLGTNSLLSGGVAYRTNRSIVHPEYNPSLRLNDIGLLQIVGQVNYTDNIGPIALPSRDVDETDCTAVFTGWGNTELGGSNHVFLQEIELKILELSKCRAFFSKIRPTHICTLTVAGKGLCYGDSGSPLVANGAQIAIGSWGSPCALGRPDVYTRVYSYLDWIRSNIG